MRTSQKSGRSRGKGNRNKGQGHSPNRVYESAGPEGKVRGTPQQIIDKYQALARDAQLSGDRVGSENFQQHAEHYSRLLASAQEAANERREQQSQPQPQHGGGGAREETPVAEAARPANPSAGAGDQPQTDGLGAIEAAQATPNLVETPESQTAPRQQRPRRPRPKPPASEPRGGEAETPGGASESVKAD